MRVGSFFKVIGKILLGLLALLVIAAIFIAIKPAYTNAVQIDFTRHLGTYAQESSDPVVVDESFFGVPGSARIIATDFGEATSAVVVLNGTEISIRASDGKGPVETPVELLANNTLSLTLSGSPGSALQLRVKQLADVEMHVESRVHFNTNVSNFVAAREFYGKLGFTTLTGFPDTNTVEMAQAIGIETPTDYDGSQGDHAGGYLLHGELIGVNGLKGGVIDLIEFTVPRDDEPPYSRINHLGMAKAAMFTTDIAADYEYMKKIGVDFLSAPATRSDGTTFAIFADQDGTFYELIEVDGEHDETETTNIVALGHITVNASDFERSSAWYQLMGYDVAETITATDSPQVANAMGLGESFERNGAMLVHRNDSSAIELVQWITPFDSDRPYDIPVNHLGIHRTAFATNDIAADVATLKAQGIQFVSEITPCCSGPDSSSSIVAFYDPDGVIVELVQQPAYLGAIFSILRWLSG